jgi:hypothetical protein
LRRRSFGKTGDGEAWLLEDPCIMSLRKLRFL